MIAKGIASLTTTEYPPTNASKPIAAKLVHARIRTDAGTVGDLDVAGERRGIRHDDLVAKLAVVCDVGLRH